MIQELVNPDEWVSLLVQTDERDERTSAIDASIAEAVVDAFDVVVPIDEDIENDQISAGVVIPFTAQHDRLQGTLEPAG